MTKYYYQVWDLIKEIGLVRICWSDGTRALMSTLLRGWPRRKQPFLTLTILLGEIVKPSNDDGQDEVL